MQIPCLPSDTRTSFTQRSITDAHAVALSHRITSTTKTHCEAEGANCGGVVTEHQNKKFSKSIFLVMVSFLPDSLHIGARFRRLCFVFSLASRRISSSYLLCRKSLFRFQFFSQCTAGNTVGHLFCCFLSVVSHITLAPSVTNQTRNKRKSKNVASSFVPTVPTVSSVCTTSGFLFSFCFSFFIFSLL